MVVVICAFVFVNAIFNLYLMVSHMYCKFLRKTYLVQQMILYRFISLKYICKYIALMWDFKTCLKEIMCCMKQIVYKNFTCSKYVPKM